MHQYIYTVPACVDSLTTSNHTTPTQTGPFRLANYRLSFLHLCTWHCNVHPLCTTTIIHIEASSSTMHNSHLDKSLSLCIQANAYWDVHWKRIPRIQIKYAISRMCFWLAKCTLPKHNLKHVVVVDQYWHINFCFRTPSIGANLQNKSSRPANCLVHSQNICSRHTSRTPLCTATLV